MKREKRSARYPRPHSYSPTSNARTPQTTPGLRRPTYRPQHNQQRWAAGAEGRNRGPRGRTTTPGRRERGAPSRTEPPQPRPRPCRPRPLRGPRPSGAETHSSPAPPHAPLTHLRATTAGPAPERSLSTERGPAPAAWPRLLGSASPHQHGGLAHAHVAAARGRRGGGAYGVGVGERGVVCGAEGAWSECWGRG